MSIALVLYLIAGTTVAQWNPQGTQFVFSCMWIHPTIYHPGNGIIYVINPSFVTSVKVNITSPLITSGTAMVDVSIVIPPNDQKKIVLDTGLCMQDKTKIEDKGNF